MQIVDVCGISRSGFFSINGLLGLKRAGVLLQYVLHEVFARHLEGEADARQHSLRAPAVASAAGGRGLLAAMHVRHKARPVHAKGVAETSYNYY